MKKVFVYECSYEELKEVYDLVDKIVPGNLNLWLSFVEGSQSLWLSDYVRAVRMSPYIW